MAPLVILSFQSRLQPPSPPPRLRPPAPPSRLRLQAPPSRLVPPSPPSRLGSPFPPSRLRPTSRPGPPSPPPQLRPPPDPPPCMSPPVPLEVCSPPKPPDPPDVPLNLVFLLLVDTTSSQVVSKSSDLKSLLLKLVSVFSDGVISHMYVDDTSFGSECLSSAVCSVSPYWCVDWSPHLFIMLGIVFVDLTMGCLISISLPHPLIQVLSQRFLYLILADELISLIWYFKLYFDLSLFFALVHSFTAVCSLFTAVCSSIFVVFKSLCTQWQFNGLMPHISTHHVNRVVYCPVSIFMEFVLLPISSSTLCGFGVGDVLLKIRYTSNTEVLIKGFVAMLKIVDRALVAASILGFVSLIVVSKFQGCISLYSLMVAEFRGLFNIFSCLSVLYAPIFMCCICFLVIDVCWAEIALLSSSYSFSIYGE